MAFHEVYQVFNPQNKLWVKMKNGEILDNQSFKFEDVPVFHKDRNPPSNADDPPANNATKSNSEAVEDSSEEDDSAYMGFF